MATETTKTTIGHGADFQIWDRNASPPAYVSIGQVFEIALPALAVAAVDISHMQSPNGIKQKTMGMAEWSECTVQMNFRPGNREVSVLIDAVKAAAGEKEELLCRIDFGNGSPSTKWAFSAVPSMTAGAAPLEDKKTIGASFTPTGDVTITNGGAL
jgi:hypothetical protein